MALHRPARSGVPERGPSVLALDDPRARNAALSGAKAANLARCAAAGLPVLPGFVVTTVADETDADAVRDQWQRASDAGTRPLVVRSSSTVEDAASSSLAGQFSSVLGVLGWDGFLDAVQEVRASAVRVGRRLGEVQPMAVLVQRQLDTDCAGVLFGVDPVTGDSRRLVAEAVAGNPDALVSGRVTAQRYLLGRHGRVLERGGDLLDAGRCRALAGLARKTRAVFGGPQDVEWGFDRDGRLWLLQSRPVTATGQVAAGGAALLGPGPVAETFPAPLRPLEVELWVEPLREGLSEALRLTGTASSRRLRGSPVVTTIGGRVAADLELLGVVPPRHRRLAWLNPMPPARHLAAAWRVGRLRAALPGLAADLLDDTDAALAAVPALTDLDDDDLAALVVRCRQALVAVHGHEVLAGALLDPQASGPTAAGLALRALADSRARGMSDAAALAAHPELLSLQAARMGPLPPLPDVPPRRCRLADVEALAPREALRLRARWLQELGARAAGELGRRLHQAGRLPDPDLVAHLTLAELLAMAGGSAPPRDLGARAAAPAAPPLPAAFRLTAGGAVVAAPDGAGTAAGVGASPGRAVGRVVSARAVDGLSGPEPVVLVVATLDPDLAPLLPRLAGLVSETGGVLSHLAILARELHVPTVVAVPEATRRYRSGDTLLVDGGTGEVTALEPQPSAVPDRAPAEVTS